MKFIIAQVLGVIASLCLIGAAQSKSKKNFLHFNIASYAIFIVSLFLLNAYSGVINSVLPLILTIICANRETKKIPL